MESVWPPGFSATTRHVVPSHTRLAACVQGHLFVRSYRFPIVASNTSGLQRRNNNVVLEQRPKRSLVFSAETQVLRVRSVAVRGENGVGAAKQGRTQYMNQDRRSPRYTTDWSVLPIVRQQRVPKRRYHRSVDREAAVCTSYETNEYRKVEAFSIFSKPSFDFKHEIYKDYPAPIFRRADDSLSTDPATFGIVPRERIPPHVKPYDTMNARAETIGEKRSFSGAWKNILLCLVPCEAFFEPNYETGKAVRWRIRLAGEQPTAIAGLWRAWDEPHGVPSFSFTM
jgi:hypothetical protein